MTSRESWTSLAERVEKVGGVDREIDREVAIASGVLHVGDFGRLYRIREDGGRTYGGLGDDIMIRRFTASVDAVLALISETLPGWEWHVALYQGDMGQACMRHPSKGDHEGLVFAATPALALLSAYCACRAASVIEIAVSGERDG